MTDPIEKHDVPSHQVERTISLINNGHQMQALSELYKLYGKSGKYIYDYIYESHIENNFYNLEIIKNQLLDNLFKWVMSFKISRKIVYALANNRTKTNKKNNICGKMYKVREKRKSPTSL